MGRNREQVRKRQPIMEALGSILIIALFIWGLKDNKYEKD